MHHGQATVCLAGVVSKYACRSLVAAHASDDAKVEGIPHRGA